MSTVEDERRTQAQATAEAWLTLVDRGEYAKSWDEAASYFKSRVGAEQWQATVRGVRQPLGALTSRSLRSAEYHTTLPGAPDGEYVVCQYATSFAHKREAIETVTCMRDTDKRWKVSGYFIK